MDQPVSASSLKEAIQRALSRWLASAFMLEIISHADLVKHFGIKKLITSLSPEVRGRVHCACSGGGDPARIAKVDPDGVAVMISSMLHGGVVDEKLICQEVSTDHMVEVLPNEQLYELAFGRSGEHPWKNGDAASKKFMSACHVALHEEQVLAPDDYVRLLENKIVHEGTPIELLVLGQLEAVRLHREGKTFAGADFIGIYAPDALVGYVELTDLYPAIEAVAKRHGWVADAPAEPEGSTGIPTEALDSVPPPQRNETETGPERAEENGDPEISVTGPASVPPDVEIEDVETDDLEELEPPAAAVGSDVSSSPPPIGKRRRRHADQG